MRPKKRSGLYFPCNYKYAIRLPNGRHIPLETKPREIPGGYMTSTGSRYITDGKRNNSIELIALV